MPRTVVIFISASETCVWFGWHPEQPRRGNPSRLAASLNTQRVSHTIVLPLYLCMFAKRTGYRRRTTGSMGRNDKCMRLFYFWPLKAIFCAGRCGCLRLKQISLAGRGEWKLINCGYPSPQTVCTRPSGKIQLVLLFARSCHSAHSAKLRRRG